MPSFPSKNRNLKMELKNWAKSAMKLSIKVLLSRFCKLVSRYFVNNCRLYEASWCHITFSEIAISVIFTWPCAFCTWWGNAIFNYSSQNKFYWFLQMTQDFLKFSCFCYSLKNSFVGFISYFTLYVLYRGFNIVELVRPDF